MADAPAVPLYGRLESGRGDTTMIPDPDGFIGTLLAIEGIADARAVLNGPNGCRGYPAYFSDRHYPRENSLDRRTFEELFYFGQPRIPCTYLDSDDYILGSTEKLREILPLVAAKGDAFLAVVNSPGASLIGDDLNRFLAEAHLDPLCMAFESAAYSRPLPEGFDETITAVLKWLRLNCLPRMKNRVNLLGFSIIQKHWQGNIAELTRLLNLMGLSVVAVPGAGSSVAELRESTTASVNIVVFPEYAGKTAEFYEREFGIPAIISPDGAPVGFFATEKWIRIIATETGRDPAPALAEIKKERTYAYHQIARFHHEAGYPKGATFAVHGDASFALPLTVWLHDYLGMIPVSVMCMGGKDAEA
ncbi:MAG: nitrogenase component 1, partial [Methanoregula sp.]|nr:nitrogenase component 1 [Methanoregula sp.]